MTKNVSHSSLKSYKAKGQGMGKKPKAAEIKSPKGSMSKKGC